MDPCTVCGALFRDVMVLIGFKPNYKALSISSIFFNPLKRSAFDSTLFGYNSCYRIVKDKNRELMTAMHIINLWTSCSTIVTTEDIIIAYYYRESDYFSVNPARFC